MPDQIRTASDAQVPTAPPVRPALTKLVVDATRLLRRLAGGLIPVSEIVSEQVAGEDFGEYGDEAMATLASQLKDASIQVARRSQSLTADQQSVSVKGIIRCATAIKEAAEQHLQSIPTVEKPRVQAQASQVPQ